MVRLSDVAPAAVEWLWPGRIPFGRLTVLDGDPGTGKSALTNDLAARVSTGRAMPDGAGGLVRPYGVVILTAEDGLADTVRPRIDAAGGDPSQVVAIAYVRDREEDGASCRRLPTVRDVQAIEAAIRAVDAVLVIIDPLMAYLGTTDAHRDSEVRGALAGLADLAERTGVAVLVVRHLRKAGASNPVYAGGGSIGIIGAARSGLLLAPDPDAPESDRRVLACTKSNLARRPPSLALELVQREGVLTLRWLGESSHGASALLERVEAEERTVRDDAAIMLREELADGPRPVRDLQHIARELGTTWRTVRRAADALGIERRKLGIRGGWEWSLPSVQDGVPFGAEARRKAPRDNGSSEGDNPPVPFEDDNEPCPVRRGQRIANPVPFEGDIPLVPFENGKAREGLSPSQSAEGDTMSSSRARPGFICAAGCGRPVGRADMTCATCAYAGGAK